MLFQCNRFGEVSKILERLHTLEIYVGVNTSETAQKHQSWLPTKPVPVSHANWKRSNSTIHLVIQMHGLIFTINHGFHWLWSDLLLWSAVKRFVMGLVHRAQRFGTPCRQNYISSDIASYYMGPKKSKQHDKASGAWKFHACGFQASNRLNFQGLENGDNGDAWNFKIIRNMSQRPDWFECILKMQYRFSWLAFLTVICLLSICEKSPSLLIRFLFIVQQYNNNATIVQKYSSNMFFSRNLFMVAQ